jgi:hypothetical protein
MGDRNESLRLAPSNIVIAAIAMFAGRLSAGRRISSACVKEV